MVFGFGCRCGFGCGFGLGFGFGLTLPGIEGVPAVEGGRRVDLTVRIWKVPEAVSTQAVSWMTSCRLSCRRLEFEGVTHIEVDLLIRL